jgi:methionyl-tRNA formyltransferase
MRLRIVFMGTPEFAVPSLKALVDSGYEVTGVFTQPDRPRGRGQVVTFSPVKEAALTLGLKVFQPEKIREKANIALLQELDPHLIVVVAYGQILSKEILELPPLGCINVHASLLPKYRGAAPIHWCIMKGERETGITTMLMDEGLDTGDILLSQRVRIDPETNCGQLQEVLAEKGAQLLTTTIKMWSEGDLKPVPQEEKDSCYAPLLKKQDEKIDWFDSAVNLHNKIRGLNPWPGAYTIYRGTPLKLRAARVFKPEGEGAPGSVDQIIKGQGFVVQTGRGSLLVTEVQPRGKKTMGADSFVNGYQLKEGYLFSEC